MGFMDWAEQSKKIKEEFKRGDEFANRELRDIHEIAQKPEQD